MKKNKQKIKINFNIKLKLFLIFFIITCFILIGRIIVTFKEDTTIIKKYKSDYVNFIYDDNFKITKIKEEIYLEDKDKSSVIVIKKIDYTNNAKTKDKSEIASSISYQVIENEPNYIETYNNSNDEKNKYYYLYENYEKEKQIEVITMFDKENIFVVIYSANSDEFDLYTESLNIVLDSIKV